MHNTQIQLMDCNDETFTIPLVTLAVWRSGLKLEIKLGQNGQVTKTVRRYLKPHKSHSASDMLEYIECAYAEAKLLLGII